MKKFEEYFSFEAIVGDLIRWRVKGRDVGKMLPPRKAWSRAGAKAREGVSPEAVRRQSIWRAVRRECGGLGTARPAMRWAQNLMRFVREVREAVMGGAVDFQKPRMIQVPKGYKDGVQVFREVASFDNLTDRVILSRMTAYVRDVLEKVLGDCCYSFRLDIDMSHQLAIARLQDWRREHEGGPMFVAECDIKKFFDSISHDIVRRCWEKVGFDALAGKVLEAYLGVYAASGATGVRALPDDKQRGLPQGGSFSTVLANLVLAEADRAVLSEDDGRLFYARYCDDVVFVHSDKAMCRRTMEAYESALAKLDLPMHEVRPFVYKPADGSKTEYYSIKSKGPFRWGEPMKGEVNCAPWVSFLGSQVRYDGETRIRKESIEKHIRSLGLETAAAVRVMQDNEQAIGYSEQMWRAWFARFRNRLIAKGVGYVTAKVKDCNMCWAGAFTRVTDCTDTRMQMRRLDRVREGLLAKVWRMVRGAAGVRALANCGEVVRLPTRHYKGRPFSYFGFLEKATRPTNMARRRVRTRALPYSEM